MVCMQEADSSKIVLFNSPDVKTSTDIPQAHITGVSSQHRMSRRAPCDMSMNEVKDQTVSKAFHIPYPLQQPFTPTQPTAVPHLVSRKLTSPCLKLHHPAQYTPSVHHHIPTPIEQSWSQAYLFVLSLYNTLCPHSLHRMASPFFNCTLALHSPQRYWVVGPAMSMAAVLKLELEGCRVGGA